MNLCKNEKLLPMGKRAIYMSRRSRSDRYALFRVIPEVPTARAGSSSWILFFRKDAGADAGGTRAELSAKFRTTSENVRNSPGNILQANEVFSEQDRK